MLPFQSFCLSLLARTVNSFGLIISALSSMHGWWIPGQRNSSTCILAFSGPHLTWNKSFFAYILMWYYFSTPSINCGAPLYFFLADHARRYATGAMGERRRLPLGDDICISWHFAARSSRNRNANKTHSGATRPRRTHVFGIEERVIRSGNESSEQELYHNC